MSLSIYLHFDGRCEEALEHYRTVFAAELLECHRYADGPTDLFGKEPSNWIMHASLRIGGTSLLVSDRPSTCDEPLVASKQISIMHRPASIVEAERQFELLAADGEITLPLQKTFWGSYYGHCTDKFGIQWMFNCPLEPDQS